MSEENVINYERHSRPIPYVNLFRASGIAAAVIEGGMGLFSIAVLLFTFFELVTGKQRWTQVPWDICILLAFGGVCSTFIVIGGIRSLTWEPSARTYVRAGY